MGHANTATTAHIYTHLFDTDDYAHEMPALDTLDAPALPANVIRMDGLAKPYVDIWYVVWQKAAPVGLAYRDADRRKLEG